MSFKWFLLAAHYVLLFGSIESAGLKDRYQQNDYNVKLEIVEIVNVSHIYGRNCTAGMQWFNRTSRVINGHGTVLKKIDNKFKFEVQLYKFLSNEYRYFPIRVMFSCSNVIKETFGILEVLAKYSNIPTNCSVPKGYYYMKNGILDFSQFPPYIPSGRYKVEAKMYNYEEYVGTLNAYAEVEEIKNWW